MSRRWSPPLVVGVAILAPMAVVGLAGPSIAPYGPRELAGPAFADPSREHLLGTNDIGQDILSQLLHATGSSLVVGVLAASLTVSIALVVGAGAALLGGHVDRAVRRGLDVMLAFPGLPLIILLGSLIDPSRWSVVVIIGFVGWPPLALIVRNQTLAIRRRGYVRAARGFGHGPLRVLGRHVLPALGPILVAGFVDWAATAVALEAGLALLGLGDPLSVSWGGMLNRALAQPGLYFTGVWVHWVLPVGLAITALVSGLTFAGVGLETWFNPRTKNDARARRQQVSAT